MTWPRAQLVVVSLVLVTSAGCIALPLEGEEGPLRMTAQEAVAEALARSAGRPVQVSALGPFDGAGPTAVGPAGQAGAWLVTLWNATTGNGSTALIMADGTATVQPLEGEPNRTEPVDQAWAVDSPEAMEAALTDDAFQGRVNEPGAMVSLDLYHGDRGPVWTMLAWTPNGDGSRLVHVDASTGELRTFDGV